mmetsp:Transcript_44342/g.73591  ORF Transcript_44342/g.73591 Transcript_44342/m.73591 type:complete len:668 (-) Transcript_44342:90-2093(-)
MSTPSSTSSSPDDPSSSSSSSEEADDLPRVEVNVHVVEARARGQAGDGHDVPRQRVQEARAHRGPHVPHVHLEPRGHALGGGVAGERVLRLGDADGQAAVAGALVGRQLGLGLLGERGTVRAVDVRRHLDDLLLQPQLQRVEEAEALGGRGQRAGRHHRLGQGLGALAAQRPVVGLHGGRRAGGQRQLLHGVDLRLGVSDELVDGDYGVYAELARVLDVLGQVGAAGAHQLQVFLLVHLGQRRAGLHLGPAAVHLQRAHGGHNHGAVGHQPAVPALDVEELLHADVRPEAGLRDHEPFRPRQLQRHLVGHDGAVPVGDVREGPRVYHHGRALHRLHQRGHERVLHEHGQGAAHTEVLGRHRRPRPAHGHHDAPQPVAHVPQAGGEGQDGHDLGGHGDVEARLAAAALLGGRLAHGHAAHVPVAGVDHALPGDGGGVDVQAREPAALLLGQRVRVRLINAQLGQPGEHGLGEGLLAVLARGHQPPEERLVALGALVEHARVDRGGQQVVRGRDRVDVARQVQVELLHRHHLRVPSPGGATLDAKGGALAGLPDAGEDLLAQHGAKRLAEADGGRALTLAQRRGVHARDHHIVAVTHVAQPVQEIQRNLGLVLAVKLQLLGQDATGLGNLAYVHWGHSLRDVNVRRDRGQKLLGVKFLGGHLLICGTVA